MGTTSSLLAAPSPLPFSPRRSAALNITTVILSVASTAFVKAERYSTMLIMVSPRERELSFEWAHSLPNQAMTRLRASLAIRRQQFRKLIA